MYRYPFESYTTEFHRKRMPNIRSLGGIYFTDKYDPSDRSIHNFQEWHGWNCDRCEFDILFNKQGLISNCNMQADIIINLFEHHKVPETTLVAMGMNRYGIGTCAGFEEF